MPLVDSVRVAAVAVAIALAGAMPVLSQEGPLCPGDLDGDGQVTSDELVTAVERSLSGCDLQTVELRFRGRVGDLPFACGTTYENAGAAGSRWLPTDFRFYVHGVRLIRADRSEVALHLEQNAFQNGDVALLDFEDDSGPCSNGTAATNAVVRGQVPRGEYTGVRFALGVPFERNHVDASSAPSPLNLTAMFWGWRGGYKFLRVDSFVILDDDFPEFRVHLGSTGCRYGRPLEVAGCTRANRADLRFDDFAAARDVIVADLGALVADSDLTVNLPETAPGCMADLGDSDCDPLLRNLGVDPADGFPSPPTQKFFRVEAAE